MTQAHRQLPSQDTAATLPTDALAWQNQANAEVAALWRYSTTPLTSIAGTNALTASTDGSLVSALTGYQLGQKFSLIPVVDNTGAATINIDSLGVKNILNADASAVAAGTLKAGTLYVIVYDGTSFRLLFTPTPVLSIGAPGFVVQDQKPQNTHGGTFTAGSFQTRVLNTVIRNALPGASLSSNQITLPAGSYYVEWSAPAYAVNAHQTRFHNISIVSPFPGGSMSTPSSAPFSTSISKGSCTFTLSVSNVFELQHQCLLTRATDGFGLSANFMTEVYSEVKVWKVG